MIGRGYFCLWTQTKLVTPRITSQECSRFVTYGHHNMWQRMLTLLHFWCEWKLLASNCGSGSWDLGGATAAHCWTKMLLTNQQQGNCFQRQQPPQNWVMRFFYHAVPTRDLFARETKMPSRTFKSINEAMSLLYIFTTWLALSSLITTPKGLFA